MTRGRRLGLFLAIGLALGLGFAAYLQPGIAVDLANQLWNCF